MANITLTIDDELLKQARIKAAAQGTSVNAVVRSHLQEWAAGDREREKARAITALLKRARESTYSSGGRKWSREELYEERLSRYKPK